MQIKILSLITPMFQHDSCGDCCKFKGAVKLGRGNSAQFVDVYACIEHSEIIARYGNDGEYRCLSHEQAQASSSDFWKAVVEVVTMNRVPAKWTPELIRERLTNDQRWLFKGITTIYNYQTADEQATDTTREDNGVGFSGVDAEFLSSLARQIKRTNSLSEKQLAIAKNKMPKYAGQLARIANNQQ